MLTHLKIKNVALIDDVSIEFGAGLNLLTGETGSGKSIIVDSLGALTGDRVSSELIKEGRHSATIEGLFAIPANSKLTSIYEESGLDVDPNAELIIRRELSSTGKNRVFINDISVTQALLKRVGKFLVDIHGQGEQAALYDVSTHVEMLDEFADVQPSKAAVAESFKAWKNVRAEIESLEKTDTEKLQMADILTFQVGEIQKVGLRTDEDRELEDEKRRLANIEKLSTLSAEAFSLLYDNTESTAATLEKAERRISELAGFEPRFAEYFEGIASARAVIEDLAISIRDFGAHLEASPDRLNSIEDRLAEISRLKRKYGATIEAILEHLADSEQRLQQLESAESIKEELSKQLAALRAEYLRAAGRLHTERARAAKTFEQQVEKNLSAVALQSARFEVRIESGDEESLFSANGLDRVEFYFSANPGESPRPLARVASGGEASRLMLILKTTAKTNEREKAAVFDEIDVGIGGRVAEAVGRLLRDLASSQQVLCVTHQPQIASLADHHFVVEKETLDGRTVIHTRALDERERVEEIARMLAGEHITGAARENARAMLAAAKSGGERSRKAQQ